MAASHLSTLDAATRSLPGRKRHSHIYDRPPKITVADGDSGIPSAAKPPAAPARPKVAPIRKPVAPAPKAGPRR